MSCCLSRGAERLLPPSKDNDFDMLLVGGFLKAEKCGALRISPTDIQRRCLSGTLGLVAQFSQQDAEEPRQLNTALQQVVPSSAEPTTAVNFTKAEQPQVIGTVQDVTNGSVRDDGLTLVLACESPIAANHVLFVPRSEQLLPQVLTEELMLSGLHLLAKSGRPDFRLAFDSPMAGASVNHFHWHGVYLSGCAVSMNRLPIEKVDRSVIAGAITEGRSCVELLVETQWHVRGFVLTAGCCLDTPGENPPADVKALAGLASRAILELHRRNIPHNVILVPPAERRRKQATAIMTRMAHEEEAKPNALSPEVYVLPRLPENQLRTNAGFGSSAFDVAGLIRTTSETVFQELSEDSVRDVFKTDIILPEATFEELICKFAWLPA